MRNVSQFLIDSKKQQQKLLSVLLDPDKIKIDHFDKLIDQLKNAPIHLILVGGSNGDMSNASSLVAQLKRKLNYPILLFPGHPAHLIDNVDAILFNVLISGNNPDYLINYQVEAMPFIEKNQLETIPNGYMLIDGGRETAVQKVSKTIPLDIENINKIINTALVSQYLGHKTVYLEAGSGANIHVPLTIIKQVAKRIKLPLIVGGGIQTKQQINSIFEAGADVVVIGTAFENNLNFFND